MPRSPAALTLFATLVLAGCGGAGLVAPSSLKAEPLSGGAHLTWRDNSSNETEFMIERKTGSAAFATVATVPFDTSQYHDAPLTSGTSYVYRVLAMGSGGHSAAMPSNEVSFKAP